MRNAWRIDLTGEMKGRLMLRTTDELRNAWYLTKTAEGSTTHEWRNEWRTELIAHPMGVMKTAEGSTTHQPRNVWRIDLIIPPTGEMKTTGKSKTKEMRNA